MKKTKLKKKKWTSWEKTSNLFPGDLIQIDDGNHLILLEEKLVRDFPEQPNPSGEKYIFMDTVTNEIIEEWSLEFKINSIQYWITTVYRTELQGLMRFHPFLPGTRRKVRLWK